MNKKIVFFIYVPLVMFSVSCVVAEDVAPDFTLTDIDGVDFHLNDYEGGVVLLEFFSTLCGSCVAELQHLKVLSEEFGEELTIVSISVKPSSDTVEKLQQFRHEHEINWIVARDTIGMNDEYGVQYHPTLVIIDQEGYIQHRHIGLTDESVLREEISEITASIVKGDINGDGSVDIYDVVTVSIAFGSISGDSNWNLLADLNNDGTVDIFDVVLLAQDFGKIV